MCFFAKNRHLYRFTWLLCAFFLSSFCGVWKKGEMRKKKLIISNRINNNNFENKRSNVMLTSSFFFSISILYFTVNAMNEICVVNVAWNLLHDFWKNSDIIESLAEPKINSFMKIDPSTDEQHKAKRLGDWDSFIGGKRLIQSIQMIFHIQAKLFI